MPFYEYECENCKFYTEVLQKITDAPLRKCPSCGKNQLKKLVSAPVFRLKGAGWYETDFKSDKENKRNLAVEKDAETASSDKASETASADAKSGDKATEPKSDAKSDAKSGSSESGAGERRAGTSSSAGARSAAGVRGAAGAKTADPPHRSKASSSKAAESRRSPSKPSSSRSRSAKPASRAKSKSSKRR